MNKELIQDTCLRVRRMRLSDAIDLIVKRGLVYRIVSQDGLQFAGTSDTVPFRINLEVIDDTIVEARAG
jgi:hypothetical protein